MKLVVLICLLFGIASGNPLLNEHHLGTEIKHGDEAQPGEFPYIVALKRFGRLHCAGSILNSKFVLTAAHCLEKIFPNDITVVAGDHQLSLVEDSEQRLTARSFSVHPLYGTVFNVGDDIGLVEVNEEFQFNNRVKAISLPQTNEEFTGAAITSGWGRTELGHSANILQKAELQILSDSECHFVNLNNPHDENDICAGSNRNHVSSCKGDSGGPLAKDNKLIGVVSRARLDIICVSPTVYTEVSHYIDWINLIIQ